MRIVKPTREKGSGGNIHKATGEGHTSKALDIAADYYLRMHGESAAIPTGKLAELLETAEEQGSPTAPEIAAMVDTEELPVEAEISWSIG